MTFNETMDDIAKGFEAAGVAVLVVGFTLGFVQAAIAYVRGADRAVLYRTLRSFVGRTILLSLEILVEDRHLEIGEAEIGDGDAGLAELGRHMPAQHLVDRPLP